MGNDVHAASVDFVLSALGVTSTLFSQTAIIGSAAHGVQLDPEASLRIGDTRVRLSDIAAVWNRRMPRVFPYPDDVHPSDRRHLKANVGAFIDGVGGLLIDRFNVNPLSALGPGTSKIRQLCAATSAGLRCPRTLVSNDLEEVHRFSRLVGKLCVKPFQMYGWQGDGAARISTTAIVEDIAQLDARSVSLMPLLYQEYIEKHYEARVTVFGKHVVATKIDSQSDPAGSVDWRNNDRYLQKLSPARVPESILSMIFDTMERLGIIFGTFDFAVTPRNEWVFFEVNQAGQFLWQEEHCESSCVLEPFARFLASRNPSFQFDQKPSKELSFQQVLPELAKHEKYVTLRREKPLPADLLGYANERMVPG